VQDAVTGITSDMGSRQSEYHVRERKQADVLNLPL
jgi:hypothetical protein